MSKPFRLGDYLKPEETAVPKLNTERIEYLKLDCIEPDPDNFYSLEDIEDLAENIELVGLLDPIRVRPNGNRYIVVSGHRRRAACMMIRDGGNPMFDKGVPCIVERGGTAEWNRLRLIFANSHTRVLSPAEISRQADEVLKLLTKLKASGVELPGRMREHVAEALNVSSSKLGRVQAIRRNLVPELLAMYDAGKINEAVAYRISQEDAEMQGKILTDQGEVLQHLTADGIAAYVAQRRFMDSHQHDATSSAAAALVRNDGEEDPEDDENDGPPRASAPTGEQRSFAPDEYLRERAEEDGEYRERLLKTADRFLDKLAGVCTRQDGIEILKQKFGGLHAGWVASGVYVACEPRGLRLRKRVTSNSFSDILRTWTEVYDILCTIAINGCKKLPLAPSQSAEPTAPPEGEPSFRTGTPTKTGYYAARLEFYGKPIASPRVLWWDEGVWYNAVGDDIRQHRIDSQIRVVGWYPLPVKGGGEA